MAKDKITKDMNIGDIVIQFPDAVGVMLDEGVHCIGCGVASFETIEEGLKVHGKTDEEIKAVVKKMNDVVEEASKFADTVRVTKEAARKVKEVMKKEEKEGQLLRVKVAAGGCAGFEYDLSFDEKRKKDDELIEVEKVKFVFDPESFKMLKGGKVDYVDGIHGTGFKISNPNGAGCDYDH